MLYLIGLGLWDENDISLKGIEACKSAHEVFAELYTASWGGNLDNLGNRIGKEIKILERKDIEEGSRAFLEKAKTQDIALLVPGDPLVATTHVHLLLDAGKMKIGCGIVHSSSIFSAVARTGLQIYKFGRTATVVTPQEGFNPSSFYGVLEDNQKLGLHTLFLLDIKMGTKEGIDNLLRTEKDLGRDVIRNRKIVACSKLGSDQEKIVYDKPENMGDLPAPAVIIVPGELHFLETETLEGH